MTERLHLALAATLGDPDQVTDDTLAAIGASRDQLDQYAAFVRSLIVALQHPVADDVALRDFLEELDRLNQEAP